MATQMKPSISSRTVGRLCVYRRILSQLLQKGSEYIFSRDLAAISGVSASQVRQDLMNVPAWGTPQNGYTTEKLLLAVNGCLGQTREMNSVLLGAGHLGQAILHYFNETQPKLKMKAIFEADAALVGSPLYGVPVFPVQELDEKICLLNAQVAILAVPESEAQEIAETLVSAGICSILNFTPARLQLPAHVFVENNDIQLSLERVAFYAGQAMSEPASQTLSEGSLA